MSPVKSGWIPPCRGVKVLARAIGGPAEGGRASERGLVDVGGPRPRGDTVPWAADTARRQRHQRHEVANAVQQGMEGLKECSEGAREEGEKCSTRCGWIADE